MGRKPKTEEEKIFPIWCGECRPMAGPFTPQESKEHNGPTGVHASMWANGAGPPGNRNVERR